MRRVRIVLLTLVVAICSIVWSAVPAVAHPEQQDVSYYLSLGDSLSVGWQPEAVDPTPENPLGEGPTKVGYPNKLFEALKQKNTSLELIQLG